MKSYKLTIIIPHYNSSDLLEKLLSTIPKDSNIEVIVIDDKSENKHIEYINSLNFSEKYIDFLFLKNETSKKGAGVARNIGMDHAHGKWILFADADDYFSDNFYESISEYFESDNEIVFFKPTSIYIDTGEVADRHKSIVKILEAYKHCKSQKSELDLRYNLPGPTCKLIKKDFLDENNIKFDEVLVSNDIMFSTKVGHLMKDFKVVNVEIYVITRSYGSLTTDMREEVFDIRFKKLIEYAIYLKERLTEDDFNLLNLARNFRNYIVKSMQYGIIKLVKTLIIIQRNDLKFFHYRLLNPIHLLNKTLRYRQKIKKDEKYITNEKL